MQGVKDQDGTACRHWFIIKEFRENKTASIVKVEGKMARLCTGCSGQPVNFQLAAPAYGLTSVFFLCFSSAEVRLRLAAIFLRWPINWEGIDVLAAGVACSRLTGQTAS